MLAGKAYAAGFGTTALLIASSFLLIVLMGALLAFEGEADPDRGLPIESVEVAPLAPAGDSGRTEPAPGARGGRAGRAERRRPADRAGRDRRTSAPTQAGTPAPGRAPGAPPSAPTGSPVAPAPAPEPVAPALDQALQVVGGVADEVVPAPVHEAVGAVSPPSAP